MRWAMMNSVSSLFERRQRLADQRLRVRVERARRLVEHEHLRARGERAREADPLLLAAGDGVGARADDRLVALRPADHVVVDARQLGGAFDGLVVDVAEEADVVGDRRVQQARFLRHVGDLPVPVLARELLGGDAVDQIAPRVGLAQLQQQLDERRLARAGRADDADHLAAGDVEADVREHRALGAVGEGDLLEGDLADTLERAARRRPGCCRRSARSLPACAR